VVREVVIREDGTRDDVGTHGQLLLSFKG